jgi:hypothetical protein
MSDIDEKPPWYGTAAGRGERGLFDRGNKAAKGHGRPRDRSEEIRKAFLEAATPERAREIEAALYELAIGGDVAAARLWMDHAMGRPNPAADPRPGPAADADAERDEVGDAELDGWADARLEGMAEAADRPQLADGLRGAGDRGRDPDAEASEDLE